MALSISNVALFNKLTSEYGHKELIHLQDFFLVPMYLVVLYFILKRIKRTLPSEIQPYFLPGYFIRILGIIVFLIHHILIYKGGVDSFTYYWASDQLHKLHSIDPHSFYYIMTHAYDQVDPKSVNVELVSFIFSSQESVVIKITTVVSYLAFNSYIVTSLLLGLFAYGGCWSIFRVFYSFYPKLHKWLALTCLFIPSVFFWSSVISKEILCIGAMGYFFYAFYELFFKRKGLIRNAVVLIVMGWLLAAVKVYILLSFLPAILLLLILLAIQQIRTPVLKLTIGPLALVLLGYICYFLFDYYSSALASFSMETILDNARNTYVYLTQEGFADSRYSLGEFDPTLAGIAKLAPQGINVTLFRPYFWEANKPITLIASLESTLTFLLTIFIILKARVLGFFVHLFKNPIVLFSMIFALFFSMMVGITAGNFGTLMRYKIPMMPFYFSALVIIYFEVTKVIPPEKGNPTIVS